MRIQRVGGKTLVWYGTVKTPQPDETIDRELSDEECDQLRVKHGDKDAVKRRDLQRGVKHG